MLKFTYLSKVGRRVLLAGLCIGVCAVSQAGENGVEDPDTQQQEEGESISDSVSNIWNKVSTAVSDAAKVGAGKVKDVSIDVSNKVSDTAVSAWDKSVEAYNDYTAEDKAEEPVDPDKLDDFGSDGASVDTKVEGAGDAVEQKGADVPPIPQKDADEKKLNEDAPASGSASLGEFWGSVTDTFTSVAEDNKVGGLWDRLNVELDEIAGKIKKEETLPESVWVGEDKASNRAKINKMLGDVLEILEVSNVGERRAEYEALDNKIVERNQDIIEYREKMVVAPEKVSTVKKVWSNTVSDYRKKIAAAKIDIADFKDRQEMLLTQIQLELKERSGIKLNNDQIYSLVAMVSGDSYIKLNSIFHNIKQLVAVLEELSEKNQDYITSINKYYGMYAVLVEALKLAHETEIDKIRNDYLPKIEDYRVKAEQASEETLRLIRVNENNQNYLKMLEGNLQAQVEVKKAATEYTEYLQNYLVSIEDSKRVIDKQLAVVLDTWKTTRLASGLLSVMKASSAGLKDLLSMKLPSIAPLNIGKLKDQFSSISSELRK